LGECFPALRKGGLRRHDIRPMRGGGGLLGKRIGDKKGGGGEAGCWREGKGFEYK